MKLAGHNRAMARARRTSPRRGGRMRVAASIAAVVIGIATAAASAARREPPPPPPPAATYSITDLGNLGFQATFATAINNGGQVTGRSGTPKTVEGSCSLRFRPCPTHVSNAFLWSAGTIRNLGTLGGNYSEGTAINDLGEVVGSAQTKSGSEACLFRNGKMTGIGSFSPAAINESGVIAGSMSIPGEGHTDAVLWQNGKITDLGCFPAREASSPTRPGSTRRTK